VIQGILLVAVEVAELHQVAAQAVVVQVLILALLLQERLIQEAAVVQIKAAFHTFQRLEVQE
jgi:hypothetical protein